MFLYFPFTVVQIKIEVISYYEGFRRRLFNFSQKSIYLKFFFSQLFVITIQFRVITMILLKEKIINMTSLINVGRGTHQKFVNSALTTKVNHRQSYAI